MENEYKVEETKFGVKTAHPSYGTLLFNRAYGGKTPLFGSSIEHSNVITMELRHADITRGLNRDYIYGNKPIAIVEMSYSQFAEAITAFGQGTGIPVTIRYTEKDGRISSCDFISKREQFTDEFKGKTKEAMNESQQLIQDVTDLFSQKKALTKADKEALKIAYEELSSMMPDGENDEIFEAAEVIGKMIYTKEKQTQKNQLKHVSISRADRKYKREINSMFNDLFDSM